MLSCLMLSPASERTAESISAQMAFPEPKYSGVLRHLLHQLCFHAGAGVTQVSTREGEDALLPFATDTPVDLIKKAFDWKKDTQEVFMYENGHHYLNGLKGQDAQFKGRVQFHQEWLLAGNASLILSNVTKRDSGEYKVIILDPERLTRYVNLTVGE